MFYMNIKRILIPLLIILLLFSIVVMGAPNYVNVGPTTEFEGDVGVPAGSGYYIGDVKLEIDELVEGWTSTHLEDQLFFGELAGTHFLDLLDTPISYTGEAGKYLRANAGETALEFATPAGAGTVTTSGTPIANDIARFTGATVIEGRSYAEFKADLDLEIGTDIQAFDNALTSISGLTYVSPSLIKLTANDTYAVRTLAEVKTDLSLNNVTNDAQIAKSIGTAQGDLIYFTASATPTVLAKGAATEVLTMNAGATAPEWAAAGGGYTNLTSFVDQTAWRVFYSNTAGDITELALGADGTYLKSNGAAAAPTFATPAGAGDVVKVGTPVDSQVGVWTGDGTIEGAATLTYDGSNLQLTGDIGSTGTKITKGWFTDLLVTNAISGSITGNAATCTTASAGDAAVDFFGEGVDAVTDATTCTDIEGTLLSISTGTLNAAIPEDHITSTMLKDDNAPADEDIFCYELTGTTGHWYSRAEVGIGVATSITDDLIVKADFADEDWGDMTVATNVVTIDADAVTYAKIQNVSATDKVLGRSTAGADIIEEIACTAAGRAIIDDADASAQRTTLGLVIGTDVLAEQTVGIADDNLLEVDDADAADNDYAKFTANGLEGRSYAELMKDITPVTTSSANNTLTVDEAGLILVSDAHTETLPTAVGNAGLTYHFVKTDWDYDLITLDGHGAETFNYENSTGSPNITYPRLNTPLAEVTTISDGTNWQVINEAMGQAPTCWVYLDAHQLDVTSGTALRVDLNAKDFDIGNIFDYSTWVSGTATTTSTGHLIDTTNNQFTEDMVNKRVKNTTDTTYTYITVFNSASDVSVRDDIFVNGEGYEIKHAKVTIPIAGKYFVSYATNIGISVVADKRYIGLIRKNGTTIMQVNIVPAASLNCDAAKSFIISLSKDDYLELYFYSAADVDTVDVYGNENQHTYMQVKLISKD